ncbi:hypothetical protein [Streptomyces xiamenensis]|uniref:hypothetical protein n=1 Tax=Streptomyces xiamenensis TaxID=408015 RepID=UPI0035D96AC0
MTTANPTRPDSKLAAASIFITAFNIIFEDDPTLVITVHPANGTPVSAVGYLNRSTYLSEFDPDELDTFLNALAEVLAAPQPTGALTIYNTGDVYHSSPTYWAWSLEEGMPSMLLGPESSLLPRGFTFEDGDGWDPFPDWNFDTPPQASISHPARAVIARSGLPLTPSASEQP